MQPQITVKTQSQAMQCLTVCCCIVGVVDVGITWKCSDESAAKQMQQLEHAAVLRPLTDKYLTELSNPRWLTCPLEIARGQKGVFEVQVPLHALPK